MAPLRSRPIARITDAAVGTSGIAIDLRRETHGFNITQVKVSVDNLAFVGMGQPATPPAASASNKEGAGEPADHPLTGDASVEVTSSALELGSASVITTSQTQGNQTFSLEQTKLEQKGLADAHRCDMAEARLTHELEEKKKDNTLRRVCFGAIVTVILAVLAVSAVMAIVGPSDSRGLWMGVLTTILGSLLGAIAGYFAGKSGN